MTLNGWQRIGVVATGLWIFGFGGVQLNSALNSAFRGAYNAERLCETARSRDCSSVYEDSIGRYREAELTAWAIATFLPIPLAWGVAYLAVGTFRWVRKGFRPQPH